MSIWKDNTAPKPAPAPAPIPTAQAARPLATEPPPKPEPTSGPVAAPPVVRPEAARARGESLIAADITIEGKIEGGGSVRIAGKFKGDVSVEGDLTIEGGARLTGRVRADKVTIAGELEGNVESASRIDLLLSGTVIGDLKARSLTVAAGATMRGRAEFGGEEGENPKGVRHPGGGTESGSRS